MTKAQLAGGARAMGLTGMNVSRLGYGSMELSGPPRARDLSEADVGRLLGGLLDQGINYIDTSIDYGMSEVLIGKTLSHRRSEYFLASKCGCQAGLDPHEHGEKHVFTPENVIAGVEQSLRRLQTDYLDVVQVHGSPTRKELEDAGVVDAMLKLQRDGKVRHLGISSRLPQLADFVTADYFTVIQVPYSALQRTNEAAISDLKKAGKAIVARGVTGRGAPAKDWATRPIGTAEGEVRALWERAKLDDLLNGLSRLEFMIRFVLANDDIDVPLVATTNPAHLTADIEIANRGPLDPAIVAEAKARLDAAGGGAGQGKYKGGGPTTVL